MLARIRKSMDEKDQGFTLIELLVVMIIIGILAAVAIPVFLNQKKKANDSAVKSDLTNIAQLVETSAVDTQLYPTQTTYTTTTAGLQGITGLSDAKVSSGDLIQYKSLGTPVTSFCLIGSNSKATADGSTTGSKYWIYNSATGGLAAAVGDSSGSC